MPQPKLLAMVIRTSGLLTLAILLIPDHVQASCGSYVQWKDAARSHPPAGPCNGPECRSQKTPESPFFPPAPTTVRISSDHWAIVGSVPPALSQSAHRIELESPRIDSAVCSGGVFRPPRLLRS